MHHAEENPLIQAPEHLFLGILSNEGFSWNLNVCIHVCMAKVDPILKLAWLRCNYILDCLTVEDNRVGMIDLKGMVMFNEGFDNSVIFKLL